MIIHGNGNLPILEEDLIIPDELSTWKYGEFPTIEYVTSAFLPSSASETEMVSFWNTAGR